MLIKYTNDVTSLSLSEALDEHLELAYAINGFTGESSTYNGIDPEDLLLNSQFESRFLELKRHIKLLEGQQS